VNPRHQLIIALAGLSPEARSFKDDAVHLLFDEARVLAAIAAAKQLRAAGYCSCFNKVARTPRSAHSGFSRK